MTTISLDGEQTSPSVAVEATDQTFMVDVIEASKQLPVVVDFWAVWCAVSEEIQPWVGPVLDGGNEESDTTSGASSSHQAATDRGMRRTSPW